MAYGLKASSCDPLTMQKIQILKYTTMQQIFDERDTSIILCYHCIQINDLI